MTMIKKSTMDALKLILQPGDAIVSNDTGLATFPIRWLTSSPYTHIDAYVGEVEGTPLVVGAGPVFANIFSKVRIMPLSYMENDFVVMRPKEVGQQFRHLIASYMLEQVDQPYGYLQYVTIGYRIFLRYLNREFDCEFEVPTKDKAPAEWVCSELYAAACDNLSNGFYYFGVEPINVYPGHIVTSEQMECVAQVKDGVLVL